MSGLAFSVAPDRTTGSIVLNCGDTWRINANYEVQISVGMLDTEIAREGHHVHHDILTEFSEPNNRFPFPSGNHFVMYLKLKVMPQNQHIGLTA